MNWASHAIVAIVVLLVPLSTFRSIRRLRMNPQLVDLLNRTANNILGSASLWFLVALVLINWYFLGRTLSELGLGSPFDSAVLFSAVVVALSCITVLILRRRIQDSRDFSRRFMDSLEYVRFLLPRTRRELYSFFMLSISAGICEEIIFRGFMFDYLSHYMDVLWVVIVSSLLFGLAHAYQGLRGIPQTALIGLVLALLYLYSGSLWASILLHAAIDLGYGYLSWLALQQQRQAVAHT